MFALKVKAAAAKLEAAAEDHRIADKVARSRHDLYAMHGMGTPEGVDAAWVQKEAALAKLHAAEHAYNEAVLESRAQ